MVKPLKRKIDMPPVTNDEAVELMTHHLLLAASYYEATSGREDSNLSEMLRLMTIRGDYISPSQVAATAWFDAIRDYYNRMNKKASTEKLDDEPKPN